MRWSVRALCCVHWSSSLSSAQAQFTALVGCVMPSRPHTTMVHKPVRRRVHGFVVAGPLRMTGPSRPDHPPRGADLAAQMLSCRGANRGGCAAHRGRHNHFQLYPLLTEQVQLSKCLKLGGSSRFGKSLSLGHASRVQDGWKGLEPLLSRFSEVASLLLVPHLRRGSRPFQPSHYWHFQSPKRIMSYDRRCDDHLPPQRRGWV